MHPQRTAAALDQHRKIAASLRRLNHAKGVLLVRDGKVLRVVGGDLQEPTGVRPPLIDLAGGMQTAGTETRPESRLDYSRQSM